MSTGVAVHRVLGLAACALVACTSAWNDSGPPPFTAAETNRALQPVPASKARCYDGSDSKRRGLAARLTFIVYVREDGTVHTEPASAQPHDPELIDCMRRALDELRFPAKDKTDQLVLQFEMGPGAK